MGELCGYLELGGRKKCEVLCKHLSSENLLFHLKYCKSKQKKKKHFCFGKFLGVIFVSGSMLIHEQPLTEMDE